MTIRLLAPYPYQSANGTYDIPAGAIVDVFNAATQAGLIAAGLAVDTASAATWQPPSEAALVDRITPAEVSPLRSIITPSVVSIPSGAAYVLTPPASATPPWGYVTLQLAGSTGSYTQSGFIVEGVLPPLRQAAGSLVTLFHYTTDGGLTRRIRGVMPGESIGSWTWTELQALSPTTYDGCVARVSGVLLDVAGTGSDAVPVLMVARGGRWRYLAGTARHRMMPAQSSATRSGTSETIDQWVRFVAGLLKQGDKLELQWAASKSGSSETFTHRIRFGAGSAGAGAVADTLIYSSGNPATTNLSVGVRTTYRIESSSSMRKLGSGNDPAPWAGQNANAVPAVISGLTNMDSTDTYMSLGILSSAAVETLRTTEFEVVHHMVP